MTRANLTKGNFPREIVHTKGKVAEEAYKAWKEEDKARVLNV